MPTFSHSLARLSMLGLAALGGVVLTKAADAGQARATASDYYGRWAVSEDRPVFTALGRLYKTIDIVHCGRGFCGVSVDDRGKCGAVLFRFTGPPTDNTYAMRGRGKWGDTQKNLEIYADGGSGDGASPNLEIFLGDGHNFGGRSASMPKFHAPYRRLGTGRCSAR